MPGKGQASTRKKRGVGGDGGRGGANPKKRPKMDSATKAPDVLPVLLDDLVTEKARRRLPTFTRLQLAPVKRCFSETTPADQGKDLELALEASSHRNGCYDVKMSQKPRSKDGMEAVVWQREIASNRLPAYFKTVFQRLKQLGAVTIRGYHTRAPGINACIEALIDAVNERQLKIRCLRLDSSGCGDGGNVLKVIRCAAPALRRLVFQHYLHDDGLPAGASDAFAQCTKLRSVHFTGYLTPPTVDACRQLRHLHSLHLTAGYGYDEAPAEIAAIMAGAFTTTGKKKKNNDHQQPQMRRVSIDECYLRSVLRSSAINRMARLKCFEIWLPRESMGDPLSPLKYFAAYDILELRPSLLTILHAIATDGQLSVVFSGRLFREEDKKHMEKIVKNFFGAFLQLSHAADGRLLVVKFVCPEQHFNLIVDTLLEWHEAVPVEARQWKVTKEEEPVVKSKGSGDYYSIERGNDRVVFMRH